MCRTNGIVFAAHTPEERHLPAFKSDGASCEVTPASEISSSLLKKGSDVDQAQVSYSGSITTHKAMSSTIPMLKDAVSEINGTMIYSKVTIVKHAAHTG